MLFKDQVDFIRQHMKKNRLRVFMTVLAATMGTAFLIVLASVGFGIHDTIRSELLNNRLITQIMVYPNEHEEVDVEGIKKWEDVRAVVERKRLMFPQETTFKQYTGQHELVLTDFKEEAKVGFELQEGRLPQQKNEVVVGSHFIAALIDDKAAEKQPDTDEKEVTYRGDLIGETVSFAFGTDELFPQSIPLKIVGIAKEPTKEWNQDWMIYGDEALTEEIEHIYQKYTEEASEQALFYGDVNVYAYQLDDVKTVSDRLKKDYSTYSVADELKQVDVFFLALKVGLVFVGTIAVMIASIGIFNTMTMAVTERTREIGVMKAIGASPKLIQRIFLMESAWIGIIGTVLAILISYGVSYVANLFLPAIVSAALGEEDFAQLNITFSLIPWQLVLIASAISLTVSMLSGWRPARKATKIDVIQALRQEL